VKDTVKIVVSVRTNRVGSEDTTELEFGRDEWESRTDDQQEAEAREAMFEMIDAHGERRLP